MIYLVGYDDKVVDISYHTSGGKGKMHISVARYMEQMPLTKVKKLLNIIKSSDNPEAVDSFKGYVTEWLKQYDIEQKVKANSHVDAKDKAKELEKTCQHYMAIRSRFKKKSERYEHWNELVKSTREEMNKQKRIASSSMADFKANLKNKDKFLKVLEFIEQGR